MKLLIIISAYNEASVIGDVLSSIKNVQPGADILVVDDGSTDSTTDISRRSADFVVRHEINRGLGGAIGTGLLFAKHHGYDMAVTMDADGQHDPEDIAVVIEPLQNGTADVVIGSRLLPTDLVEMPSDRVFLNKLANMLTYLLFRIRTSDSQSGFRAFGKQAIRSIQLKTERMEVSTEIFAEIQRNQLIYDEVPIRVVYTPYSRGKGQRNRNAFNIVLKLLLRLFR